VVRADSRYTSFDDLRGAAWAYNEPMSHSGYNVVRHFMAGRNIHGGFFGPVVESGSHQASIDLIVNGVVDGSAIDSTVLEAILRRRPELASRFGRLHTFLVNKWYFDEIIDFLVVRPAAWLGRFSHGAIERVLVQGALVGGASGTVRALSAAVRGVQTGYLRYYAALLLVGLTALGAYFLVSA